MRGVVADGATGAVATLCSASPPKAAGEDCRKLRLSGVNTRLPDEGGRDWKPFDGRKFGVPQERATVCESDQSIVRDLRSHRTTNYY